MNPITNTQPTDNIVAMATAHGHAGVGIIRISGFDLDTIVAGLTGITTPLIPRHAQYVNFRDAFNETIDAGLIIYFNSPYSFTGEDIIELHGHGSPVALNMLINRCLDLGCRMANPGEFSRRAYLNGKIDLVQAESIIDLINAESEASVRGAFKSMQGTFSKHIGEINSKLIDLRMFVEATLDFPEEDIEFIANAKIKDKLTKLQQSIRELLSSTRQGVILNNGANVVIVGRPNVGKSSLMNALANEDVAIVTAIAGTTRDIVKEKVIINGIALNLIDTAGIRDTRDVVEKIGIERAHKAIGTAELCLVLLDSTMGITEDDQQILDQLPQNIPRLYVQNKTDLTSHQYGYYIDDNKLIHVYVSAKNLMGLDALRDTILKLIGFNSNNTDVFIARTRHLNSMKNAVVHIDQAFVNWNKLELLAEELRYAHNALGEITGTFSADDLLGVIFSQFCIGK